MILISFKQEHLLKLGTIYSLSEANITSQLKIINIEYDDERVCDKLVNELNNVYIGVILAYIYYVFHSHINTFLS